MRTETEYSLRNFSEAVNRLSEGIESAKDELDKDGVIQRFEFTFELLWKSLKLILFDEGIICQSPKECLKSAFRFGLLDDEDVFINMLNDRNTSSHIYSSSDSEIVFLNIKGKYQPILQKLSSTLFQRCLP